jgi:hypothetical protein
MRYIIVTPYFREDQALLERCLRSVRHQSVPTEHLLVSDGHPQGWLDRCGVRHLRLDRSHGDFGNTPRGIGAMLAIAEGYDAIGFLDADNWLESTHVETCIAAYQSQAESGAVDYVVAKRFMRRPDESILPVIDESNDHHVDTNCFFFYPGSYPLVPYFGLMPKELSPVGDRIFYQALRQRGLKAAFCNVTTVNYHCMWENIYLRLGEQPPEGAKPNVDRARIQQWLNELSPAERTMVHRMTGITP